MNISAPFIRRPVGTSLVAAGLFALGMICYSMLGISALPQISFPGIFIMANQPGANAKTMASTVAAPLERHLGQVPGIDSMNSYNSEGGTFIFLRFSNGTNINNAARQVQAAINAAASDLPAGLVAPPTYRKVNVNDDPIIQLALTSGSEPLSELYERANRVLKPRIAQLPGVASVEVAGSAQPSIRVDVDLAALNAMGLTTNSLRNALRAATVRMPLGALSDGRTRMIVSANDQLHTAEQFANIVIATHDGNPIHLGDVADVYQGAANPYRSATFNGQPSISLRVLKFPDANVIATVDSVKNLLPELHGLLPPGAHITPFYDGTPTVRASVLEIQITLVISLFMVILIMAVFLRRLAPTLIAATAVPLSLAGSFVAMYAFNYTLDNMSLLALVIALAFVVDDAIVVIENITRYIDQGKPPREAAFIGAREIGFTIVSITASLIAVFIPLLFAPGMMGVFFREFTVTLIAAIAVSMLVSLTLTPALCGVFLRPGNGAQPSRVGAALERFHAGMLRWYMRALDFVLRHPLTFALQPLVLVVVTFFLFGAVKGTLFPQQDTGLINGRASAGSTLSFEQMTQRQQQITRLLLDDPAVRYVGSRIDQRGGSASVSFSIQLQPLGDGRSLTTRQVLERLNKEADRFPDFRLRMRAHQDLPSGGGGRQGGGQYQISLLGNNAQELETWLPRLVNELKKNPIFTNVGSDVEEGGLQQTLVVDRDKAARLGVSVASVDQALYNAFGQRQIATIYAPHNQYQVVLNALPSQSRTPEALNRIHVRSRSGKLIPITAVTHQESGLGPTQVRHRNQFTSMDLSFNLADDATMGEARKAINATIENMRLPGSIHMELSGYLERFASFMSNMIWLLLSAILAVYIVLGILYENLIHPITILSTLPSAGVGALLALLLTNTPFSVVAMMALVLLIGLVKKNAIMMIDFALVAQREGMQPVDAIRDACSTRFRPIIMTTMVAILAALPLAIGIGAGAELRRPLGIAVIGGLIVSQSLTLLSSPAIYLVFTRQGRPPNLFTSYFGLQGRLSRKTWWLYGALLVLASLIAASLLPKGPWLLPLLAVIIYMFAALAIKRAHDCGQHGWYVLLAPFTFALTILTLPLLLFLRWLPWLRRWIQPWLALNFGKGPAGDNRFGAPATW